MDFFFLAVEEEAILWNKRRSEFSHEKLPNK